MRGVSTAKRWAPAKRIAGSWLVYTGKTMLMALASQGKEGVVIVRTSKAILLAHYPEHVQPGSATADVEKLGDYLISVGY